MGRENDFYFTGINKHSEFSLLEILFLKEGWNINVNG